MNEAHFHLVVNHLPIVGILIGILVLLTGFLLKKSEVKITALGIFVFSALASIAAFYSGEGAEEIVERIPGISETLINQHEESAELFFTVILILGGVSLVNMFLEIKKSKLSKFGFILVILISMAAGILAKNVGTTGGEIRHTEIRNDANLIQIQTEEDHHDED
jgi:glucan phosphoethanolaminetransferase (alkaline phosphatase superfamily)